MADWARAHRDPARPLAWFHAPSVGEGLQARVVLDAFRRAHPEYQVAYTHYSPSASGLAASMDADFAGYLPYDRRADVDAALDALTPGLVVFTKLDLWPELATRASRRGATVAMIAATVLPDSGRLSWPARAISRAGYRTLAAVGAVSDDDAIRMASLGADPDRITVTGDPRIDSVIQVVEQMDRTDPLVHLTDPAATLVAGSTWPGDEAILVAAFLRVRGARADARLVIVPHEPTADHVDRLEAIISGTTLTSSRLSRISDDPDAAIIIVDRMGALATLYGTGEIAYVGGGWGRAGIHSVLEPAAWARPVVIGPADRGSNDAALLRGADALIDLPGSDPATYMAGRWLSLLDDHTARHAAGLRARQALEPGRGAAARSVTILDRARDAAR